MIEYIYGVAWILVAALLIFRFSKESKYFYLAGGWFVVFGIWTIVDQATGKKILGQGAFPWIFRGVTLVVALILIVVFLTERKSSLKEPKDDAALPAAEQDAEPYEPYEERYNEPQRNDYSPEDKYESNWNRRK